MVVKILVFSKHFRAVSVLTQLLPFVYKLPSEDIVISYCMFLNHDLLLFKSLLNNQFSSNYDLKGAL